MAKGDIEIVDSGPFESVPTRYVQTEAGATDIKAGEPVKRGGTGNNFAIPLADADPEITADIVLGVAAEDSNHTASVNGKMEVYVPSQGVTFRAKAETAGNVATGILLDRVTFDLSSSTYTVNEDEGDDSDHGLVITDIDTDNGTVDFEIRSATTLSGNNDV